MLQYKLPIKVCKNLKNEFDYTYKFGNHVINKFTLLLRKGVYPDETIDDWEKFDKTSLR